LANREFQLHQKNMNVGLVASYSVSDLNKEYKELVQKLKNPILAVSIMDDKKGQSIANEKWSFGKKYDFSSICK